VPPITNEKNDNSGFHGQRKYFPVNKGIRITVISVIFHDQLSREKYKKCKHILQRENRNFLNKILWEKDKSQGSIRHFFKTIKKYIAFNPILKAIKYSEGTILMEPEKKIIRWKESFVDLLNDTILPNPIEKTTYQ
jgi:hypothetical protein